MRQICLITPPCCAEFVPRAGHSCFEIGRSKHSMQQHCSIACAAAQFVGTQKQTLPDRTFQRMICHLRSCAQRSSTYDGCHRQVQERVRSPQQEYANAQQREHHHGPLHPCNPHLPYPARSPAAPKLAHQQCVQHTQAFSHAVVLIQALSDRLWNIDSHKYLHPTSWSLNVWYMTAGVALREDCTPDQSVHQTLPVIAELLAGEPS